MNEFWRGKKLYKYVKNKHVTELKQRFTITSSHKYFNNLPLIIVHIFLIFIIFCAMIMCYLLSDA